jgi:hypothetical protein
MIAILKKLCKRRNLIIDSHLYLIYTGKDLILKRPTGAYTGFLFIN